MIRANIRPRGGTSAAQGVFGGRSLLFVQEQESAQGWKQGEGASILLLQGRRALLGIKVRTLASK